MLIYVATNTVNGKIYIGQTCNTLAWRWRVHVKDAKRAKTEQYFHRAIRRYGEEAFVVEELARVDSREELDRLERFYILAFESYPPSKGKGYNMTEGGEGYRASYPTRKVTRGWHHSEESRRKISLGHIGLKRPGRVLSQQHRENISKGLKKRVWKPSEKWLAAREAQNGKERPEMRGRKQSPEDREKKRQAALRRWAKVPVEERREILKFNREPKSKEHRKNIAQSVKALWADPKFKAEQSRKYREGWARKQASV
jgi:group I intron endonuclease